MQAQKRVLAIHDISCVGKCSLTVALPILSAAGLECSVLPTAVLSTHTGGFTGYTFRDLTQDIEPICRHWQTLNLHFDGIYTGYLGSFEQLELVSGLFDSLAGEETQIIVDPVMGDNGVLYPLFDMDFAKGMAGLCAKADLVVPNLTEATCMLGEKYQEGPYSVEYLEGVLHRLSEMGPRQVALTGVSLDDQHLGVAVYDRESNRVEYAMESKIEGYYHGTGDVFASALVGAIQKGLSLREAAQAAVDFTVASIRRTRKEGTDIRYGVNFEANLAGYMRSLAIGQE